MKNSFFKKLFKESNLIIIVPAIFVVLTIIGFFIYGLSEPNRTIVAYSGILTEQQKIIEQELLAEYNQEPHNEENPFLKLNPYGISPLTGLIMFETDLEKQYVLVINGESGDATWEFITDTTTSHRIPVYGLLPGVSNSIEIYNYDSENEVKGDLEYLFITTAEDVPESVKDVVVTTTYDYFLDDLMMLTPATDNYPVAYDYNGDVRWYLDMKLAFTPEILDNGHILIGSDRVMSDPYYTPSLYEIDLLGKVYKEYYIPGGYHHDIDFLPSGNFLILTNDFEGTVEDYIIELNPTTNTIVNTWDIADYIPTNFGKTAMWTEDDWFHANSIDYDEVNDSLIVSGRHLDIVLSISYNNNVLNWILGDPTGWAQSIVDEFFFTPTGDDFEWQYAQHSAMALNGNQIFLFDNGNNKSKNLEDYVLAENSYSRGVIYTLNTTTMEISQTYQYGKELGSAFYSPYISNVQYYGPNHYMIHSGGIATAGNIPLNIPAPLYEGDEVLKTSSTTYEILDDEIVYQLDTNDNYYQAVRFTPYKNLTTFTFGDAVALGLQSVSKLSTNDIDEKITLFHNVPRKYELNLLKETDRLVVEGVFQSTDVVYLVLEGKDSTKTYSIPTTKNAYTAMCTGIFQGDNRTIIYYINEAGLTGEYSVFLNVNGHKYDSYQKVEFN